MTIRNGRRAAWGLAGIIAATTTALAASTASAAAGQQVGDTADGDNVVLCQSEDFTIYETGSGAAAGTIYVTFALDRRGVDTHDEPCLMYDRFGVHWTEYSGGDQVGGWARYDHEIRDPWLVGPDDHAVLTLAQPNPGNYDPEECEPAVAHGVRAYLEFHDDPGVDGATDSAVSVCANPEVGTPRMVVEPSGA